jgi:hypothetical protein
MTGISRFLTILLSTVFITGCANMEMAGRGMEPGAANLVTGNMLALGPSSAEDAPLMGDRMTSHFWELADQAEAHRLVGWVDEDLLRVTLAYRKDSRKETERMIIECKDNKPLWNCGAVWDVGAQLLGIATRPINENDPVSRRRGGSRPTIAPDDYAGVYGISAERCCGRPVDYDGAAYLVVSPIARTPHGAIVRAFKKDGAGRADFSKTSYLLDTGTQRYLLLADNELRTPVFTSSPSGCRQAVEYARAPKSSRKLIYMDICGAAEAGAFANRPQMEARNEEATASPRNW